MTQPSQITAAQGFVRSFNVLIKQVGLYGLDHARSVEQADICWSFLNEVLAASGKMTLTAARDSLLLDGSPLRAGTTEKALAERFGSAGMAGVRFLSGISREEFFEIVQIFAKTKPIELLSKLKSIIGSDSHFRVAEFNFDAAESIPAGDSRSAGTVAGHLMTDTLGAEAAVLEPLLRDPRKLLQLLASAQSVGQQAPASPPAPVEESDVSEILGWLKQLAGTKARPDEVKETAPKTLKAEEFHDLRDALASLVEQNNSNEKNSTLMAIAEQLAINCAMEKYQRGEIQFDAVQETLQRLKQEIGKLHQVINAQDAKLGRAGLSSESYSDLVDRQFWAGIPDRNKEQLLLSKDAWCLPYKNIRSYVQQLCEQGETAKADEILSFYCRLLHSLEAGAFEKVAIGLKDFADLYERDPGLLAFAIESVRVGFGKATDEHKISLLAATMAELAQRAAQKSDFNSVHRTLFTAKQLAPRFPQAAETINSVLKIDARMPEIIESVLSSHIVKPEALAILKSSPTTAVADIVRRFASCSARNESKRLLALTQQFGTDAIHFLREQLSNGSDEDAIAAIGILSTIDLNAVETAINERMTRWTRPQQAQVIRQIAISGIAERGRVLLSMLVSTDPLVLPLLLDEIGMCGIEADETLLELASGQGIAASSPFLQLKAIETIGRLRSKSGIALLRTILSSRSMFGWKHPREIRIAAAQALQSLSPSVMSEVLPGCGLSPEELRLPPLAPQPNDWVHQRRYLRVPLSEAISASLGDSRISVSSLSLGGGFGASANSTVGVEAPVELALGRKGIRGRAMVTRADSGNCAFVFLFMDLEDRNRLHRFLAEQAEISRLASKLARG